MADFLFIYRSLAEQHCHDMAPEALQQVMQKWMDWIGTGHEEGWMIDGGDALKPEGSVLQGDASVTDGPFAESKELVGGYSIIRADSMEQACERAKSCPHHETGGSIEIRELAKVGSEVS